MNLQAASSTVNTLSFTDGGVLLNAGSETTRALNGGLNFTDGTAPFNVIRTASTGVAGNTFRNININSIITGDGTVRLIQAGTIALNNTGSSFSGTWHIGGTALGVNTDAGPTNFTNTTSIRTAFSAVSGGSSTGSLGENASVIVDTYSYFTLGYDWNTTGSLTLVANGNVADAVRMSLTQDITVGALTVAGNSLAQGVYDNDYFSTNYANYFTGSGGSITVVPEPTTCMLLIGGLALAAVAYRRQNS